MGINQLLVQYFLENEFSKKSPKKTETVDDVGQDDMPDLEPQKSLTPPKEEFADLVAQPNEDNFDSIFKTQGQ